MAGDRAPIAFIATLAILFDARAVVTSARLAPTSLHALVLVRQTAQKLRKFLRVSSVLSHKDPIQEGYIHSRHSSVHLGLVATAKSAAPEVESLP